MPFTFARIRPVLLFAALFLLAACAPAGQEAASRPAAQIPGSSASSVTGGLAHPALQITPTPGSSGLPLHPAITDTEQQLTSVYLPPRDRVALAQRLLGVEAVPADPTAPVREWQLGDSKTFWVDNVDNDTKFEMQATLRHIGQHVYMWVQSDAIFDLDALRRSAETFDTLIYPAVRAAFGSERSPGVDGDQRVHILHAADMGFSVAAYFASDSAYPVEAVSTSNGHEMFYVNLDTMADAIGTAYYDGVLAHEFQHMIHWNLDINEDTWLNEGMSELAALLAGFDNAGFASYFLEAPETQLNAWPENASRLPHYGAAFLFVTYFYERFGAEATRLLAANAANGMQSIEDTLRAIHAADPLTGQPITAETLFADWLAANLLRDPSVGDGRYAYTLIDPALRAVTVQEVNIFPHTSTASLAQYGAHNLNLTALAQRRLRVEFQGQDSTRLIPVDAYSGRYMWYSNRGDNSDSTLTRAFDLSGLKSATLEFYTWYHIEHLWDYAYVMVSSDDGATWTILRTDRTTDDDPHDNAYGPGYTGSSGSNLLGPAGWVQQRADLTPFVGGRVLVRFELITDEATNQPGMVIDDVSIPAIGYFDDFESGPGGWASQGWLYIDNVLTQRWLVQAITRGPDGVQVSRLLLPEPGQTGGAWEFDVGGPAGDVTLIISPLAPVTTEPAQYTLNITAVE